LSDLSRAAGTTILPRLVHGVSSRRFLAGAVAVLVLAAAARAVVGPGALGYDAAWSLIWGLDLAAGRVPDLQTTAAPTPHPLSNALAVLLSVVGRDTASTTLMTISWLSLGALAWGITRVGATLFSWPVGLLAALIVMTRDVILMMTTGALVDLPFLALVIWAALLEIRQPRRGTAVLLLLAAAGLLRPEAWLLSGAYAIWILPAQEGSRRMGTVALAAGAPAIWTVADLCLTGDPFHSLHGTQALAGEMNRPRSFHTAIELAPRYLRESLGPTAAPIALVGVIVGLRSQRRASVLPCVLIALGLATFLALGVADLPLLERYLLLPTVMLALFCAVAALGWTALPREDKRRRAWQLGGTVAVALLVLGSPRVVSDVRSLQAFLQDRRDVRQELRAAMRDPAVARASRECDIVASEGYHRPFVILWLERPPASVVRRPPAPGVTALVLDYVTAGPPAPGARTLYEGERWSAMAMGC
jgi:hypothetical protein